MLKKILSFLQYIFFLGLGLGLLWYSFRHMTDQQLDHLKESIRQTRFIYLIPVVFTLLLAHLSRSLRWRILMHPLGYNPSRKNVFFAVMVGYFFNMLVPRLGEVMKCTTLAKYEKVPPDKMIGTIVAERAFDLICLIAIIIFTVLIQYDTVGHFTLQQLSKLFKDENGRFSFVKFGIYILGIVLVVFLLRFLFARYGHKGFLRKMKLFVKGIGEGLATFRKVDEKGWLLFHTVFMWNMYLVSIYIGFYAFPQIVHLGIKGSLSILTFGSLGMIIPTPGGIGSYQYMIVETLLLYDVDEVTGFAFGNVLWAAQTMIVVVFGLISMLLLPLFNRKNSA